MFLLIHLFLQSISELRRPIAVTVKFCAIIGIVLNYVQTYSPHKNGPKH